MERTEQKAQSEITLDNAKNAIAELYRANPDRKFFTAVRIREVTGLEWYWQSKCFDDLLDEGTLIWMRLPSKSGKTMQSAAVHKDNVERQIAKGGVVMSS